MPHKSDTLRPALVLLCVSYAVIGAQGAYWLYGTHHDGVQSNAYNYAYLGRDWPQKFGTCGGNQQSPTLLNPNAEYELVPQGQQTLLSYGTLKADGTNLIVNNDGHNVGVPLGPDFPSNVTIAVRGDPATSTLITKFTDTNGKLARVQAKPIGFHFHTPSEHLIGGRQFPLEMHIVHAVDNKTLPGCGTAGCLAVVAVMFEYGEQANPFIETIFSNMPIYETTTNPLPAGTTLDISSVLPSDTTHITYPGSLTTPPCTQGVLWHVLQTPQTISRGQVAAIQTAIGDSTCPDTKQPAPASGRRMLLGAGATGRALLAVNVTIGSTASDWRMPAAGPDGCTKLTNGQNNRDVQALNNRPVWLYTANKVCPASGSAAGSGSSGLQLPAGGSKLSVNSYFQAKEQGRTVAAGAKCPS